MKINDLLNRDLVCACGRTHRCDIEFLQIGQGALKALAGALAEFGRIFLVADGNTYPLCGATVREILGEKIGGECLFGAEPLVPDEKAVARMEECLPDGTDFILGIGSGVINDLCKYVSFRRGIRSGIIATAPSMDGYASSGAALILDGMKVTYTTHAPAVILGDTEILRNAPLPMIRSGYGDIIGKYSSLNDWRLAHLVRGEHFCPYIYEIVKDATDGIRDSASAIAAREGAAIERLMEALVLIGVTLTLGETTRPGSGSEHHLSHFFEIVGLVRGESHFPHGTDVAYNTILTAGMREEICRWQEPEFHMESEKDRLAAWERIYGPVAPEVRALQKEAGSYDRDLTAVYRERWPEILEILSDCPSARVCEEMMSAVGLDFAECEKRYGPGKIRDAQLYGKDLKDRYSVLWLYYALFSGKERERMQ